MHAPTSAPTSLLQPIARLGKDEWGALGKVTSLRRSRYADWPDE